MDGETRRLLRHAIDRERRQRLPDSYPPEAGRGGSFAFACYDQASGDFLGALVLALDGLAARDAAKEAA